MFLEARRCLWYNEDKLKKKISEVFNIENPKKVIFEVGYWRKANAIHKWFVDNIQDGNDDCNEYSIDEEKLKELLELVNKVLKNKKKASELLPTSQGFFFGSYEYDKYYFEDLELTKKIIENLLNNREKYEDCEIYYRSSW